MAETAVRALIRRWREDPGGTYQTWFLWDERLKNFRSIRRGLQQVVGEIEGGTFGNVYKGSSFGDRRRVDRRATPDLQGR